MLEIVAGVSDEKRTRCVFSLSSGYEISQTHFHKRNVASAFFYLQRDATFMSWLPLQVLSSALPVAKMELFYAELMRIVRERTPRNNSYLVPFALRFARVIFLLGPDIFRHRDCHEMCNTMKSNWFLSRFCHLHTHWYRNVNNITWRRNDSYFNITEYKRI